MELNNTAEGKNFVCLKYGKLDLNPYYSVNVETEDIQELIDEAIEKGFTYVGHIILHTDSYGCGNGYATGVLLFLERSDEKFVGGYFESSWYSCEEEDSDEEDEELEILKQCELNELGINCIFKDEISYALENLKLDV